METVRETTLQVFIRGADVTAELTPFLLSVTYEDAVEDEADSLSLTLTNPDGRFTGSWYPVKGDTLEVLMGYPGDFIPTGVFEIDQVDITGPPTVLSIKAISAAVTKDLRTTRSDSHEDSDLKKIAEKIATRHGLTLEGEIFTGLRIERSTQFRETDLCYLARMAKDFGYVFSIRDTRLVFTNVYTLEGRAPVTTIDLTDLIGYSFSDKTTESYGAANVRYQNPDTGEYSERGRTADTPEVTEADTLEVFAVAKNPAVADARARAALHDKNTRKITGNLTLPGRPSVLAGNNYNFTGLGVFDGLYHVVKSSHSLSPAAGYATTAEVKKIG